MPAITLPDPPSASCASSPWTSPPFGFITDKSGQTRRRILRKTGQILTTASVAYAFLKCGTWYAVGTWMSDYMELTLPGLYGLSWTSNGNQHGGTISSTPQSLFSPHFSVDTYWDFSLGSSGLAGTVDSNTVGWTTIPLGGFASEFAALTAALKDPANWSSVTYTVTGSWSVQATAWEVWGDGFRGTTSGWREYPSQDTCARVVINGVDAVNTTSVTGIDFYILGSDLIGHSIQSGGGISFTTTPDLCQGCQGQAVESYPTGTDGGTGLLINPGLDNNSTLTGLSGSWGSASWGSLTVLKASGSSAPSGTITRLATLRSRHWPHQHLDFKLSQREIPTAGASSAIDATITNQPASPGIWVLPDPADVVVTTNDATTRLEVGGSGMWVDANSEGTPSRLETGGVRPPAYWMVRHTGEISPTRSGIYAPSWSVRCFPKWDAIKITESYEKTLEGSSWSIGYGAFDVWLDSTGTSVSVASGALRILSPSGFSTGIVYSTPPYLEDRYIKVRYRSTGAASKSFRFCLLGVTLAPYEPQTITMGGVDYSCSVVATLTTGADGEWVEVELDLLQFATATLSTGAGRWSDTARAKGWLIDTMTISGTQAIEIAWIKSVRKGNSRVSALSPLASAWYTGTYAQLYPESVSYHASTLAAYSGGMLSLAPATVPTSPSTLPFVWGSVGQLADVVNRTTMRSYANEGNVVAESPTVRRWSEWSIADLAPPRSGKPTSSTGGSASPGTTTLPWAYDDLFDSDAPSWCLGGDGLLATGGTTLAPELDKEVAGASGATLRAQRTIHFLRLYPGMGACGADGQAPGSYSDTTLLWVQAVWAGQVVGCVVGAEEGESAPVQEYLESPGSGMALKTPPTDRGSLIALANADGYGAGDTPLRGRAIRVPPGSGSTSVVPWWRKWGNRLPESSPTYEGQYGADPGGGSILGIPSIEPLPRQRWMVRVPGVGGLGVASLASPEGWYAVAYPWASSGTSGIYFRRTDHGVPGAGWQTSAFATTNASDRWPALGLDPWGKLTLLYERSGIVYARTSEDEGASWSSESMAFSNGKFPDIDSDPLTGAVLRAAVVPASSGFVIRGQIQHPGDASPSTEFTFQYHNGSALVDLKVKRSAFRLECGHELQGRWNLICTVESETDPSYWWCADGEGRTWTRIT